ncbi:MAG: hypothetical protein AB9903_20360 [Vulcanimicrobiota bacterium]
MKKNNSSIKLLACFLAMLLLMLRPSPSKADFRFLEFSEEQTGRSPEYFTCVYPGAEGSPHGVLTVLDDENNRVLAGLNENTDKKAKKITPFFIALLKNNDFLNGELSAKVKIVSGHGHAEGGLVWRYRADGNYMLYKYCAIHNKVTLYSYSNGYKSRIGIKNLNNINRKKFATWHTMKVKASGEKLQCWFDGTPVFDIEDRTHCQGGKPGLLIGNDSNVYYDDIMTTVDSGKRQSDFKLPPGITPWKTEVVDRERNSGKYPSLSFDRNGMPAIAYYAQVSQTGRYAIKNEKGWNIEPFERLKGYEHFICLSFNRLNEPNLAFCFNSPRSASPEEGLSPYFAYLRDSRWNTAYSFENGKNCYISMALDKDDYPHIACLDTDTRQIKIAGWNGREWVIDAPLRLVRKIPDKGFRLSLAINSRGVPCIAYFGPQYHSMNYMEKRDGKWIVEIIDAGTPSHNVGEFCSLALDSKDIPHISYYDTGKQCLKYAVKKKRWKSSVVDSDAGVGTYSCIAIDRNDSPHIAYYDPKGGIVRYCTVEKGRWKIVRTDCQGSLFSMKLSPEGIPHIAFMDSRLKCLKLGHP